MVLSEITLQNQLLHNQKCREKNDPKNQRFVLVYYDDKFGCFQALFPQQLAWIMFCEQYKRNKF